MAKKFLIPNGKGKYMIGTFNYVPQDAICEVPMMFGKEHEPWLKPKTDGNTTYCVFDEVGFALYQDSKMAKELAYHAELAKVREHNDRGILERIKVGIFGSFFELAGPAILKHMMNKFREGKQ